MSPAIGDRGDRERLSRLVSGLVTGGTATAASALVADRRGVLARAETPGAGGRLFDLASLTKPITATLALCLDRSGRLPLDTRIGDVWGAAVPRLAAKIGAQTLDALLRHRSGLRPWTPLYHRCRDPAEVAALLLDGTLLGARAPTYSDLGYILWGLTAERALNRALPELLGVFLPQTIRGSDLRAAPVGRGRSPGCEIDTRREVELAAAERLRIELQNAPESGSVQDGNARFLGRYSGHAGLFAGAEALYRVALEWLRPGGLLPPEAVQRALAGTGRWACGWERRRVTGSGGRALSREAFGHVGFTGGSCWVDPRRDRVFVLLAHRARELPDLDPWRRRFHGLEFERRGKRLKGRRR